MSDVDDHMRQILAERARVLARRGQLSTREKVGEPVAVMLIGGEQMGIMVSYLQTIVRIPKVTPVPRLPPWMPGVIQIRGTVVCLVDLASWLGLTQSDEARYLAIIGRENQLLGVRVAGVAGVREIFADELVVRQAIQRDASELPVRFTTRDLLTVLDIERLFALVDLRGKSEPISRTCPGPMSVT